jgi:hypothetical protein
MIGLSTFSQATAVAAPQQLYGKSIIVSWTYNFTLRPAGSQLPFHPESVPHQVSIYVSTAGRLFMRHAATSRGGTGSRERMGGSGSSVEGGPSVLQFQGASLVFHSIQGSSAAQIKIDFGQDFGSCTASAILGRGGGAATYTLKSISTGKMIEIQSASASGASCSIKDGNVFAD